MVDFYYKIEDGRTDLSEKTISYQLGGERKDIGNVAAFLSLLVASRDLLGRRDIDGAGAVYADQIEEDGGKPILSIFTGKAIRSKTISTAIIKPDYTTERCFTANQIWALWLNALAESFPEKADRLAAWSRTPEGWAALEAEFQLSNFEAEVAMELENLTQIL